VESVLKNSAIASKQLIYAVACYILGGTLYMSYAVSIAKQDTWLIVIPGFLLCVFFAWIIITLSQKFRGKTLIEINDIVFGKTIGKIFSAFYLFYFLINTCLDIREIGNFISNYIMPETPIIAVMTFFTTVCAYAVYNGLHTILRNSFLLGALMLMIIIMDTIYLLPEIDFNRFIPFFTQSAEDYIQAALTVATIPFDGLIALPMILPYFKNAKDYKKPVFIGIAVGAVVLLIIAVRDWAVLGNASLIAAIPSFEALRLVKIGKVLTRMEIFIAAMLMAIRFFRCSILYYCFAKGAAQLFGLKSYKPFTILIGVIMVCVSIILYSSLAEGGYFSESVGAQYILFFVFLLPLVTVVVLKLKFKKHKT